MRLLQHTSMSGRAQYNSQRDTCDWRKLVETDEEWAARIDREYIVDEETSDVLARRLTPYELALLEGRDWYREAEAEPYDDRITPDCVETPKS